MIQVYLDPCIKTRKKIDIEKLRNDYLFIVFCTNVIGSHKLSFFYVYEYENKAVKKYWKNKEDVVFI